MNMLRNGPKSGLVTAVYIEVNDVSITTAGCYELSGGANVFDVAIIFAANIGLDEATGETTLILNDSVHQTLSYADAMIRPLQDKKITVLLSILGNHQGVGLSNFQSEDAAKAFAEKVGDIINLYELDGVDLDDEFSDYDPATVNEDSIRWLVSALRAKLPDKLITFFAIRPAADGMKNADPEVGSKINFAWNSAYSSFWVPEIPGLVQKNLSPAAIDLQQTSVSDAEFFAKKTTAQGYGAFLTYNLVKSDQSEYLSSFTKELYQQNAIFHNPQFSVGIDAITPTTNYYHDEYWIFKGMNYFRYSKSEEKIILGNSIWAGWPGLRGTEYTSGIDAMTRAQTEDGFWIFKGSQCALYSVDNDTMLSDENISHSWPGLGGTIYAEGIDAICSTDTMGEYWLFKGDRYIRYSKIDESIHVDKYILEGWPGLDGSVYLAGIDAMCHTESVEKFWMFHGEQSNLYGTHLEEMIYNKSISEAWPGIGGR